MKKIQIIYIKDHDEVGFGLILKLIDIKDMFMELKDRFKDIEDQYTEINKKKIDENSKNTFYKNLKAYNIETKDFIQTTYFVIHGIAGDDKKLIKNISGFFKSKENNFNFNIPILDLQYDSLKQSVDMDNQDDVHNNDNNNQFVYSIWFMVLELKCFRDKIITIPSGEGVPLNVPNVFYLINEYFESKYSKSMGGKARKQSRKQLRKQSRKQLRKQSRKQSRKQTRITRNRRQNKGRNV